MTTYSIDPDVAWHVSGAGGSTRTATGLGSGADSRGPGRVAVLDLADTAAVPFVLEGSASAIWNAVAERGDRGLEAVIEAVAEKFDSTPDELRGDVHAFLGELVARGLLRSHEDI